MRNLLVSTFLAGLVLVQSRPSSAQSIPDPGFVRWPNSGGTLEASQFDAFEKGLGDQPGTFAFINQTSASMTGDTKALLGSAEVTFGPYNIIVHNTTPTPSNLVVQSFPAEEKFTIQVWASVPGQILGTDQLTFVELGEVSKTLTAAPTKTAGDTITVPVKLPSVFDDIKVIGKFDPAPAGADSFEFPAEIIYPSPSCGGVTVASPDAGVSDAGAPSPDDNCMQAAVNPTGVLVPQVMPLTIVYEPSGDCSYANFTFTSSVGSEISLTEQNTTATNVLVNNTAAAGIFSDSSNTTETDQSGNTATAQFSSTTTNEYGTQFGLPIASPGNPQCNEVGTNVGDLSATNGPGKGDVFVFAVDPTFLYWDTGGLTTFRLSTQAAPGTQETIAVAPVRIIDPNLPSAAPTFLANLTAAQIQSVRNLDSFATPSSTVAPPPPSGSTSVATTSGNPLAPPRYVYLGRTCTSGGIGKGEGQGTQYTNTNQQAISQDLQSVSSSTANNTANAGLIVGGFGFIIGASTGGIGSGFSTFQKVSQAFDQYVVQQSTTTTVTENVTVDTAFLNNSTNTYGETFLIKDQTLEVDEDLYYDAFFGTIAFNPVSSCLAVFPTGGGGASGSGGSGGSAGSGGSSGSTGISQNATVSLGTVVLAGLTDSVVTALQQAGAVVGSLDVVQAALGSDGTVSFATPTLISIPDAISVTSGAAGSGTTTLQIQPSGAGAMTCTYTGQGTAYLWQSCTTDAAPGSKILATNATLHVQSGDSSAGSTAVRLALGAAFQAAPFSSYQVPMGAVQGLPPGVVFDPTTGSLSGTPLSGAGTLFQSVFFALDATGKPVVPLTVNVTVAGSATNSCFDPNAAAVCSSEPAGVSAAGPLVETTCCSSAGCCQSTFASTAGDCAATASNPIATLFGFDSLADWTASTATLSLNMTQVTQGCASLAVSGQGYMPITSAPFNTVEIGTVGSTLGLDIEVPSANAVANPYWLGAVQMYLTCPSANVYNDYIGQVELTAQPLDQFFTGSFPLPASAIAALQGSHPDCSFGVVLNVPQTVSPDLIDNLRFLN